MGVGQKLSPPGSPKGEVQVPVPDILEPGTPERSRPGRFSFYITILNNLLFFRFMRFTCIQSTTTKFFHFPLQQK